MAAMTGAQASTADLSSAQDTADVTADTIDPRDRLIVALDLPSVAEAEAMVARLGDAVTFYKIGMELTYAGGLALAERLAANGKHIFMDLKLHDIPNTVERATRRIARLGARFLTVHAFPQSMKAALAGVAGSRLELLAVTVLTSCDDADLAAAGYALSVKELVARRALQAKEIGIHGLILSPEETGAVRKLVGAGMQLVTPGIRPAGTATGDQKRIMTPALAIAGGADRLVVGRPVTEAADPVAAAEAIVHDIASALALAGRTNHA
jgi:orotidine-5'-phosphate decarboxylase